MAGKKKPGGESIAQPLQQEQEGETEDIGASFANIQNEGSAGIDEVGPSDANINE